MGNNRLLGVIGGLGPMATARFLAQITEMTDAPRDQDHLSILLYSCPGLPDRTRAILNPDAPSPLPGLRDLGRRLISQGAGCIAIPCITAHYFCDGLELSVPVLNALRETALALREAGVGSAGILATDGTCRARLFDRYLLPLGIRPIYPEPEDQQAVMNLIYGSLKAGLPPDSGKFQAVTRRLRSRGAEAMVLGCTELSLLGEQPGCLDAMAALARRAILDCGGRLKPRFRSLLTNQERRDLT